MINAKGIHHLCPPLKNYQRLVCSCSDPSHVRYVIGALQYEIVTRPKISYAVNKTYQFLSNSLEEKRNAIKRILRYLQGTTSV